MAGWFQVHRWGQRWRGSTCVCLRVCVLRGRITCWHTAASKSSLVCLKQDDEICRRAPNARAAVTLNHSHTSNPHAVTQHTPTHTDTRTHTNTQRHPRGPATRCTGPTRTRQRAGTPSARGHQPPGRHFILWRSAEEGVWGGRRRWWKESVKQECLGRKKGVNPQRDRTGSDVVGLVKLSRKWTC